jgi:hypothetical protein
VTGAQTYHRVVELFQLSEVVVEAGKVCHSCNRLGTESCVVVSAIEEVFDGCRKRCDYRRGKRLDGMKDSTIGWMDGFEVATDNLFGRPLDGRSELLWMVILVVFWLMSKFRRREM